MAQYYNLVADNGVPIMVENVQQICTTDGQSYHLVLQDMNNGINGTHFVTYTTQQNSEPTVLQQGATFEGQFSEATIDQRQNVYIINSDELNLSQDTLKTQLIQQVQPNEVLHTAQQIQWVDMPENQSKIQPAAMRNSNTQRTPLQRAQSHCVSVVEQGTSEKKSRNIQKIKPKQGSSTTQPTGINNTISNNRNPSSTHRLKTSAPNLPLKSTPRPITPSARLPIRSNVSGARQMPTQNHNFESMEFLSERIKHARMVDGVCQLPDSPIRSGNIIRDVQRGQRGHQTIQRLASRSSPPALIQMSPEKLEKVEKMLKVEKMNTIQQSSASPDKSPNQDNLSVDGDSGNNSSYAYLQKTIDNPQTTIVQEQINGNTVKMLVVLPNGEQRLITFDIPNEECTVHDLLEQAAIPFNGDTIVSLVKDPILNINYIVESEGGAIVDTTDSPDEFSPDDNALVDGSLLRDDDNSNSSMTNIEEPKYIEGKLAVCPNCGISSMDFNRCYRCRKKLPEDVKYVPQNNTNQQKKDLMNTINDFYNKNRMKKSAEKRNLENVSTRGRGRPRGRISKVKPIKEPECLTLSSDDDEADESRKLKKHNLKTVISSSGEVIANFDVRDRISEKEPIITNNSTFENTNHTPVDDEDIQRINDTGKIEDGSIKNPHTSLCCRTVRIGSYKYVPRERVVINQSGLILAVPLLEDDTAFVKIHVKFQDIVKVLIHFGKSMPVLFFYTNTITAAMIREVLGMQDAKGPYYDPAGTDNTHKRITLLPEKLTEDSKLILKQLFLKYKLLEELNTKEANDILIRASPKDPLQAGNTGKRQNQSTTFNQQPVINGGIEKMTVYPPPPSKGGIAINTEDYSCLGEDQFLNDVIIDFYLRYLTLTVLSEEDHQRTHVFSSYFYKRLTSPHVPTWDSSIPLTPAAKRHARVQKWTKNVNIFEKDFVIIPINEHAHWFLAIICFPGLVGVVQPPPPPPKDPKSAQKMKQMKEIKLQSMTIGSTTITPVTTTITLDQMDDGSERDEAEGDEDEFDFESDEDDEPESAAVENNEREPEKENIKIKKENNVKVEEETQETVKIPCILIFDSLAGAGRSRVVATLRDYLTCEYTAKVGKEKKFTKDTIKGACPKVPQQSNFTDCGLYVLQYVESFFKNPIKNYTLPIKALKNWFEEIVVTRKREELSKLLVTLMHKTNGEKSILLPILQFPTIDGKLKPKPEKVEEKKDETKKKDEDNTGAGQVVEKMEVGEINPITTTTIYTIVPCTTGSSGSDGGAMEMMVDVKPKSVTSGNVLSYLRNKRIPRLMVNGSEFPDTPPKRQKSEANDSCK